VPARGMSAAHAPRRRRAPRRGGPGLVAVEPHHAALQVHIRLGHGESSPALVMAPPSRPASLLNVFGGNNAMQGVLEHQFIRVSAPATQRNFAECAGADLVVLEGNPLEDVAAW
jgi:hypothetical protein